MKRGMSMLAGLAMMAITASTSAKGAETSDVRKRIEAENARLSARLKVESEADFRLRAQQDRIAAQNAQMNMAASKELAASCTDARKKVAEGNTYFENSAEECARTGDHTHEAIYTNTEQASAWWENHKTAAISYAALTLVALALWSLGRPPRFKGIVAPLPDNMLHIMRETYPRLKISAGDFTYDSKGKVWRVDANGSCYCRLDEWMLDGDTGNFSEIVKKAKRGSPVGAILSTKSESERAVDYAYRWSSRLQPIFLACVLMPFFIATSIWAYNVSESGWLLIPYALSSFLLFMILMTLRLAFKIGAKSSISPLPIPVKLDNFGPVADGLPDTGEAVPLDEYTPNA